ncbi:unnamed protein product [Lactuca virosa]|uniref:non-specific serine/threonine protein kinase n=1 Tax=Lactuca virosa TaxID=75947 RepID=A0AAU9M5E1_9ASTR|nr:unnamed protein product [Lactuca virosa]
MDDDQNQIPVLDLRQLKVLSALGRGARGVVFLVQDESSNGDLFALKTILRASIKKNVKKTDIIGNESKQIFFEQEVLRLSQHPLLPKLRGVVSTENIVGYAIDYCPGRDLNCLRKRQTERMFSDDIIRFYAAELVIALEYLHGLGIVYRDLKPENVMIQENGHLMLVDFDLSTKLSPKPPCEARSPKTTPSLSPTTSESSTNNKNRFSFFSNCCRPAIPAEDSVHPTAESVDNSVSEPNCEPRHSFSKSNSFVGTEEYVAPEMLQGNGHDFSVDWWCLGVVLHEMLYGKTPFKGINRKETFYQILSKTAEVVGEPTPLRDLIRKLLVKDPKQRISTTEIKGHDFFRGVDWEGLLQISRPPFVPGTSDEDVDVDGMDVNKIDIEAFVQGVFQVDDSDVQIREKEHDNAFLPF